jgi:hypothetical protein
MYHCAFPLHFCQGLGCLQLTDPGVPYCRAHARKFASRIEYDIHFPEVEDDFADASRHLQPPTEPAPGDAAPSPENHP